MNIKESTRKFVEEYVISFKHSLTLAKENIKEIINFIEEKYEKPMSKKLATGEPIDLEFFSSVNNVLTDLSLNK